MNIPGVGRLRRLAKDAVNLFGPRAIILLYHRVAELPADPQLLSVSSKQFAEHLQVLREFGCPLQIKQLVRALQDGKLPRRAVLVTFDDGYADNLHHAKPLLERYNTPATVFITTGLVGQCRELWWDELERLLLQPGTLPEKLCLNINGSVREWNLGRASHYPDESFQQHRHWNVEMKNDPTPRHRLYRSLCLHLRSLSEGDRRDILDELVAWAGAESKGRVTHRMLSPEEVVRLADGNLVEIGAHTVTHPVLSSINTDMQRAEISQSKADLEEVLGRRVSHFAYPYGTRSDYSKETVAIVREAGFEATCSNFPGWVRNEANLYELPRYLVRDWDGEEFCRRLKEWFVRD